MFITTTKPKKDMNSHQTKMTNMLNSKKGPTSVEPETKLDHKIYLFFYGDSKSDKGRPNDYMYGIGHNMQEALLSTSINISPSHSITIDLANLIDRDGPIKKLGTNKFEGNDWIYHLDQWDEKNPYFYLVYKGTTESCKIKCNQLLINKINKLSKTGPTHNN